MSQKPFIRKHTRILDKMEQTASYQKVREISNGQKKKRRTEN
jgi:hypothetical protein